MTINMLTHKSKVFSILLLAAVLLTVFAAVAQAQESTPVVTDDEVNRIAKQMFCPVCENVPLDVCPTQACHQWRETIRAMLAEGNSEEEIKTYFVQQYGDRVLAAPPRAGFNWLVYVVPPVLVFAGLVFFVRVLRRWQASAARASLSPTPTIEDDEYVQKLEEELKRRG